MNRISKNALSPKEARNSVFDQPAPTLLKSWSRRMANGRAVMIPVFVGGNWSLQVPRGNKRVLRFNVPPKA